MSESAGLDLVDVLLVEDDPGDVLMTREAFEHYEIRNNLHVVGDGDQALHFLRKTGDYIGVPTPGLILLDLNLPRRNGLEVLAELKSDRELLSIPVVVLTTSKAEEDILRAYDLGVNSFILKPVTFQSLVELTLTLSKYWFEVVELPAEASEAA